ncbi:MAG: PorT family protein [Bacteroidales bacterium]|nr:PorT family protein [Bacteroidales bacterium]
MKKYIYTSLFLLLISTPLVRGQAALLVLIFGDKVATENFNFSLKLGGNYSIIHGYEDGKNGFSLNFGLVNNIRLTEKLSLIPEFLPLSPRGISDVPLLSTGDPDLDDLLIDPHSSDRKLNYIDIPVLLRVKLGERFNISAGPQISFLTGATDTYKSSPINGTVLTVELDIKSELNTIDAGAVIDFEYILVPPVGGKGINIYVRYSRGFVDLLKENSGDRYTTSIIQFGATFPFVKEGT